MAIDLDELLKDNPHEYQIRDLINEPHDHIVLMWSVKDVQSVRPELSVEQCREVLRSVEHYDEYGITWDDIEYHAAELYERTEKQE